MKRVDLVEIGTSTPMVTWKDVDSPRVGEIITFNHKRFEVVGINHTVNENADGELMHTVVCTVRPVNLLASIALSGL